MDTMTENEISYKIRGAIFNVYNKLGAGLLESVYESAMIIELKKLNIDIESQVPVDVHYDGNDLGLGFRIDLLVNNKVIVEIKSVETLLPIHYKQLQTYLKLTNKKLGILVNFNTDDISSDIKRVVNNL